MSNILGQALIDSVGGGKGAPLALSFLVPLDPSVSQTLVFGSGVPEPSTWAMGLLGFAGVGALTLRRSRRDRLATI